MENMGPFDILNNFSIEKKEYLLKPIEQGFINDTFLVWEDDRPLYILQRINTTVFGDPKGLMGNLRNALHYLNDVDYAQITMVKTISGASYFEGDSFNCWRLMTYIDKSTAYDTTSNVEIASEAGRIIGKFHQLLQHAPLSNFVDTIPRFHDLKFRENQFYEALNDASSHQKDSAGKAILFAETTLPKLKELNQNNLPVRICHNDTKLNNILFSKTTHKALCLIDLDTLMKGYFHYDFGDAIRTIVSTAPEDEKEHHKVTFDKTLFEAFVKGLKGNADFLTDKEIESLPFGVVLMPFLHGLRALTDYLSGNKYYRVAYEDQNLDRALSLFNFAQKAMEEIAYMKKILG